MFGLQEEGEVMDIYVDGSGWNGRCSRFAVYGGQVAPDKWMVAHIETFTEERTVNEMEYMAILYGLEVAKLGDRVLSDSQLVVNQLTKNWKLKAEHLRPLYNTARELLRVKGVTVKWVPREENLAGKVLERR